MPDRDIASDLAKDMPIGDVGGPPDTGIVGSIGDAFTEAGSLGDDPIVAPQDQTVRMHSYPPPAQPDPSQQRSDQLQKAAMDHRVLTRYLMKQDPRMTEDMARRISANAMVDQAPTNYYRDQLLPEAYKNVNYADLHPGSEESARLRRERGLRGLARAYTSQMTGMSQYQAAKAQGVNGGPAGYNNGIPADEGEAALDADFRATGGSPQLPTYDPQAQFMGRAAPLAGSLVKSMGLDPSSAAIIAAQLFGAQPVPTSPSDAMVSTQISQTLGALSGPPGKVGK